MIEEFTIKKKNHHVKEIPLAPILDLLVVVIFFLILSSSFIELTKQTLPPSGVSTITDPVAPPPLAPKLYAVHDKAGMRVFLRWSGDKPGMNTKSLVTAATEAESSKALQQTSSDLLKEFMTTFPSEKSMQLALGPDVTYQEMVSLMDGVREHIQDIVLVSYQEATAVHQGTQE